MDERTIKTLDQLEQVARDDYHAFIRSGNRYYAVALGESVPYDEMEEYLRDSTLKEYLDRRNAIIHKRLNETPLRINQPIDMVIARFSDSRQKMRQEARKELRERFMGLAWSEQLQVMYAMLATGTMLDLEWVARMCDGPYLTYLQALESYYPDEHQNFCDHLEACCLKRLDNSMAANHIVRHSDVTVVRDNIDALESALGYRKIALRLAHEDRNYHIDKSKLNVLQYLDVCSETHRGVKKTEVWQDFRDWIMSLHLHNVNWTRHVELESAGSADDACLDISLADIDEIKWLLKSCAEMMLTDVICAISELDCNVQRRINETYRQELASKDLPLGQYDIDSHYRQMLLDYAKLEIAVYDPHLSRDVTAYDRVRKDLQHINAIEVSAQDQTFCCDGEIYRVVTNDENNTFMLERDLPPRFAALPQPVLDSALAEMHKRMHYWGNYMEIVDANGTKALRDYMVPLAHWGLGKGVMRSLFRNFVRAYDHLCNSINYP